MLPNLGLSLTQKMAEPIFGVMTMEFFIVEVRVRNRFKVREQNLVTKNKNKFILKKLKIKKQLIQTLYQTVFRKLKLKKNTIKKGSSKNMIAHQNKRN